MLPCIRVTLFYQSDFIETNNVLTWNFYCFLDLSVGLINVVTDIAWKITVEWYLGNIACKIVKYFQVKFLLLSFP